MSQTHLTVAAVVERDNHFLVVEELIAGRHVFNQPAGHVEPDEALLDAVVRETREETGWEFAPTAITGIYLWTHPHSHERFLRVAYTGHLQVQHADEPLDDGIIRALWLSRAELAARAGALRSPMVLRGIDDFLAGTRYPVTMFQQMDMVSLAEQAQVI